jgi:poly-gamma-glutamate system protein
MKLYWRPGRISNASLAVLAAIALVFTVLIETNKVVQKQKWYDEKVRAVRLTAGAFEAVKAETLKHRKALDKAADPAESGLIGLALSPITSVVGYIAAKQTSVNPNFAAAIVHMLKRLHLEAGDVVAVGASGSFPGLSIATLAACKALELKCIMISSVAASMYGANDPKMTWLDMEKIAYVGGFIDSRSAAASIGGMDDNGEQLSERGVETILKNIEKNQVPLIRNTTLKANIDQRVAVYKQAAGDRPIKAYVNVGGNEASVGSHFTKVLFKPGINRELPRKKIRDDGAMTLLMREYDIPSIHLSSVGRIAEYYDLPTAPQRMPKLTEGPLFFNLEYNLPLVSILLVLLVLLSALIIRFDVGNMLAGLSGVRRPPAAGEGDVGEM